MSSVCGHYSSHHSVPLTSLVSGLPFPTIHPTHSQADQRRPSYRTSKNLWPLLPHPFFGSICVPMLIVWDVFMPTLRICCAHILPANNFHFGLCNCLVWCIFFLSMHYHMCLVPRINCKSDTYLWFIWINLLLCTVLCGKSLLHLLPISHITQSG